MFKNYYPDIYIKSVYDIDREALLNKGIKALLFDIDNTLVPMYQKDADEKITKYIEESKKLFKVAIVSNAAKKRVDRFNKDIKMYAVHRAGKPNKRQLLLVAEYLGAKPEETALVGDQLFTDIAAGNSAGMTTILVSPIDKREAIHIRFKRILEKLVLLNYKNI